MVRVPGAEVRSAFQCIAQPVNVRRLDTGAPAQANDFPGIDAEGEPNTWRGDRVRAGPRLVHNGQGNVRALAWRDGREFLSARPAHKAMSPFPERAGRAPHTQPDHA